MTLSEDNRIIKKQLADTTAILGTILAEMKSLKSEQNSQNTNTQHTTASAMNFWKHEEKESGYYQVLPNIILLGNTDISCLM